MTLNVLQGLQRSFILVNMLTNGHSIWLEINLGAIRRNIQRIQKHTGRPVMAVVKANAYGHGILEVSRAAAQAGASFLCVARIEEALKIRQAGIDTPILVMGYTKPNKVAEAIDLNISLTVSDNGTAKAYQKAAQIHGQQLNIHAKIDTGMGRLGVLAEEGLNFCQWLFDQDNLHLEGVYTHFACADELNNPATDNQINKFDEVLKQLDKAGIKPGLIHAANSAASIYYPDSWYGAVRPGIAIYGLDPSPDAPLPPDFERALAWKCLLSSVKILPKGSGVGYGHKYTTVGDERIGVAAIGYADGFRRWKENVALLRGERIHQSGAVCMDQTMWFLDNVPGAEVGDEVVIIGQQGKEMITAEEIAATWGTINYEVVCGLTDRVHRIFTEEEE